MGNEVEEFLHAIFQLVHWLVRRSLDALVLALLLPALLLPWRWRSVFAHLSNLLGNYSAFRHWEAAVEVFFLLGDAVAFPAGLASLLISPAHLPPHLLFRTATPHSPPCDQSWRRQRS